MSDQNKGVKFGDQSKSCTKLCDISQKFKTENRIYISHICFSSSTLSFLALAVFQPINS